MMHDWKNQFPQKGDTVVRLPGHRDDEFMTTGKVYIVDRLENSNLYLQGEQRIQLAYDINYFAPAPVKSETYEIY